MKFTHKSQVRTDHSYSRVVCSVSVVINGVVGVTAGVVEISGQQEAKCSSTVHIHTQTNTHTQNRLSMKGGF